MRKAVALALGLVLLLASCGRESSFILQLAEEDGAPTPRPTRAPAAAPADEDETEPEETPSATPAPTEAVPTEAPEPPPTAEPGSVNRPKDGTYVLEVTGSRSNPLNPGAPPQPFEAEQQVAVTHDGDVYTREGSDPQGGSTTFRERWSSNRVETLFFQVQIPGVGTYECTYDPPILTTRIPIRIEKLPTQTTSGAGNFCQGTIEIEVVGETTTEDANGRSWPVWEIKVDLTARGDGLAIRQVGTQWFSPDLGFTVRSESKNDFDFESGLGRFTGTAEATAVLKSWP